MQTQSFVEAAPHLQLQRLATSSHIQKNDLDQMKKLIAALLFLALPSCLNAQSAKAIASEGILQSIQNATLTPSGDHLLLTRQDPTAPVEILFTTCQGVGVTPRRQSVVDPPHQHSRQPHRSQPLPLDPPPRRQVKGGILEPRPPRRHRNRHQNRHWPKDPPQHRHHHYPQVRSPSPQRPLRQPLRSQNRLWPRTRRRPCRLLLGHHPPVRRRKDHGRELPLQQRLRPEHPQDQLLRRLLSCRRPRVPDQGPSRHRSRKPTSTSSAA